MASLVVIIENMQSLGQRSAHAFRSEGKSEGGEEITHIYDYM